MAGVTLDGWQEIILEAAMGERSDATWAAKRVGVTVPRQNGKALDATTPILTPDRGFTPMADLAVGDRVMHPDGQPVTVIAVSEVMHDRPCYQVTTVDGRSVVADQDHLWTVTDKRKERSRGPAKGIRVRWFEERTLTTGEMLTEGLSRYTSGGRTTVCDGKRYQVNEYRFKLPPVGALETESRDLPLDPYLLGAWLGDGTSINASMTCARDDVDHWMLAIADSGFVPVAHFPSDRAVRIGITCTPGLGRQSRSFGGALRRLNLLGNKHVPDIYLTASLSQRLALLQGLMDTDGSVNRGQAEFVSTEPRLAESVLFLARSLGWRATSHEFRTKIDGRDCGPGWKVHFTPKLCDGIAPFRMRRKASRIGAKDGGAGRSTLAIASIELVESRPVKCIQVDSPDGLFLAGRDLIPTHNSQLLVSRALAGALLFGEKKIVISAHQQDTARESFSKLMEIVEDEPNVWIRDRIKPNGVIQALNREMVKFKNGATIQFKARTGSGSKGFSSDCLMLDEAQILSQRAWVSINSTMSAMPNPQVWLLGTAPQDEDDSGVFESVRESAIKGKSSTTAWCEWGADPDDPTFDPASEFTRWSANPAWNVRINHEVVDGEFETYPPQRFGQDRLGLWPTDRGGRRFISAEDWAATETDTPPPDGLRYIGVAYSQDGSRVSVAGAVKHRGGVHVELVGAYSGSTGQGVAALADWLADRQQTVREIHLCGPDAPVLAAALAERKVLRRKVKTVTTAEYFAACSLLVDAVREGVQAPGSFTHPKAGEGDALDASVAVCDQKRRATGMWGWTATTPDGDETPTEAISVAVCAAKTSKAKAATGSSGWRVVTA